MVRAGNGKKAGVRSWMLEVSKSERLKVEGRRPGKTAQGSGLGAQGLERAEVGG